MYGYKEYELSSAVNSLSLVKGIKKPEAAQFTSCANLWAQRKVPAFSVQGMLSSRSHLPGAVTGLQVNWRLSCTTHRSHHPHFPFLSANKSDSWKEEWDTKPAAKTSTAFAN